METKSKRVDLRVSKADEANLQKASVLLGTTNISQTFLKSVESFLNVPPEMYYCDRSAIRQIDTYIEYVRAHLTSFINEFIHITGQSCNLKDLQTMFRAWGILGSEQHIQNAIKEFTEQIVVDRLKNKYPGLPVEVPVLDLSRLFELAKELNLAPDIKLRSAFYYNCFAVSKSGEVTVIQDQVEMLKDSYRATASTPLELQRLAKIRSLCEMLNVFLTDESFLPEQIPALYYFDRESARFEPTGAHIKSFSPMRVLPED